MKDIEKKDMLREWLKRTDAETVKIGCKNGSSFMYCGEPQANIIADMFAYIVKKIDEYQEIDYKNTPMPVIKSAQLELNSLIMELADMQRAMSQKVLNTYPSTNVPNQLIVEVDGDWNAKYWDIDEYNKRWKKGAYKDE